MNKKIFAFSLIMSIAFTFTGCTLAREDRSAEKTEGRLIGVYISYEYIDLFDFEGYVKDNLKPNGGNITIEGNNKEYEGRLYAVQKNVEKTASKGEKYTETEFIFEEVEGIGLFSPTITDPLTSDTTYVSSYGDAEFSDVVSSFKTGDAQDTLGLEGTVYLSSGTMSKAIYINPVYQATDGRVYLVTGQGFSCTSDSGEGGVYTQTLNSKITIVENGKSKIYASDIKISVETIYPTEKVAILQMDASSNIIKKEEYTPEQVPTQILPESDTDYIVLENTKATFDKKTKVERTIFSKENDTLWFFSKGKNGVFVKTYSTILWELPVL